MQKEGRKKRVQTTKQSNTTHQRQSLFQKKNELPRVGLEPTTLYTLHSRQSNLPPELPRQLSWQGLNHNNAPGEQAYSRRLYVNIYIVRIQKHDVRQAILHIHCIRDYAGKRNEWMCLVVGVGSRGVLNSHTVRGHMLWANTAITSLTSQRRWDIPSYAHIFSAM